MPAATTHVEFAKDILRTDPVIRDSIHNHYMFWLGAQGPDMLFFSHGSVFPGSLHKYGNLLHEKKVYEVISFFERYSENDPDLQDYITGYLCHYALDAKAHPLIYGCAHAMHEQNGSHEGANHIQLEADIDVWMLHQRGRRRESYNVYKYLKVDPRRRQKLADMYSAMFKEIFQLNIPSEKIYHAIREVSIWTAFIRPRKLTKHIIFGMENLVGMPHSLSNMMLNGAKPKMILNLDHKTYSMPWDENQTVSSSFPELYGQAVLLAKKLLRHHDKNDFLVNFKGEPIEKAQ